METSTDQIYRKQLFTLTGYSGLTIAIVYAIIFVAFAISGFPLPKEASQWITYLEGKTLIWWWIIWLSIVTNLLYIPVAFGLYEYFKKKYKIQFISVGLLLTLFVFLELALTWSHYPTIIELTQQYKIATSETQKTIILSAIEYASTSFQTPITSFYTIILPSIGILLANVFILKCKSFGKVLPWIGLLTALCNIVSVMGGYMGIEALKSLVIPGSFLSLFWWGGIGIKFIKLSKS